MSTDEVAALQKELQTVKARAVGKIKALQAQVTELQAQVLAEKAKSPPEVSSSEDGSEKGFVKVGEPGAVLQRREAELDTREAALAAKLKASERRQMEQERMRETLTREKDHALASARRAAWELRKGEEAATAAAADEGDLHEAGIADAFEGIGLVVDPGGQQ